MRFDDAVAKHEPLSEYERGLVEGIYRYSWMKDGAYYVGTTGRLLGDAVDRALSEHRHTYVPAGGTNLVAMDAETHRRTHAGEDPHPR